MTGLISIAQPTFGPDVEALVLQVLRSGRLAQGPWSPASRPSPPRWRGTQAVAVTSGTAALELALELALGVGPGDEVVTSPLTFVATLNAILNRGATAGFADVPSTTRSIPQRSPSHRAANPCDPPGPPVRVAGRPARPRTPPAERGWR